MLLPTMLANGRCTVAYIGTTLGPKTGTQVPLLKMQVVCAA